MKGNKKGLLPKNGGTVGPALGEPYKEPEQPKSVRIREAKGGYSVDCEGGKHGYRGEAHVATDVAGVIAIMEKHFGLKKTKEDKDAA